MRILLFIYLSISFITLSAKTINSEKSSERELVYDTVTYTGITVIVEVSRKQKELKHKHSYRDDDCRGLFYVIDFPNFKNSEDIVIDSISFLEIIDGPLCAPIKPEEADSLIAKYDKDMRKTTIWKRKGRFHRLDYYKGLRVYCSNFKSLERLNELMDKIIIFPEPRKSKRKPVPD